MTFPPPSAGLFARVHEGDLAEEVVDVEVETSFNLWWIRLLITIFISNVPVITVTVVTATAVTATVVTVTVVTSTVVTITSVTFNAVAFTVVTDSVVTVTGLTFTVVTVTGNTVNVTVIAVTVTTTVTTTVVTISIINRLIGSRLFLPKIIRLVNLIRRGFLAFICFRCDYVSMYHHPNQNQHKQLTSRSTVSLLTELGGLQACS